MILTFHHNLRQDLKNVNWRHGKLKPYAVVWLDPSKKCSTRADEEGDASPYWDDKLLIPINSPIEDSTLYIDVVHANAAEDTKPLIGSAKLALRTSLTTSDWGVKVSVREPRYRAPDPYYAPPYGVPPAGSRDFAPPPPPPYGSPYGAPPAYGAPPSGYPAYGAPPSYGQPSYVQPPHELGGYYGQQGYVAEEKKSKFGGMGTGLAVGAVAGALGGLALAEGFDALENNIADDAAERVEDDLGYDGDD
ncbi:hypothetical protein Pfo_027818 [Paulownia fortunei]|nr:hypothetical protein Pfo_027818 [Paulownia fortunei]